MQDPKDRQDKTEAEPSFSDPSDPRWSQSPKLEPQQSPQQGTTPYADQPLYEPSGAAQNPYLNQPRSSGQYPQQQYPQANYPQPMYQPVGMEPSNVLGIISMVLGIISVVSFGAFLLPQLGAIVCGHISLSKEKTRRGFAISGLIMGYICLGLGLLLVIGIFALGGLGASYGW